MALSATQAARQAEFDRALPSWSVDPATPGDLFGVVDLLAGAPTVRRSMADPTANPDARAALARQLLTGRVGAQAVDLVVKATSMRWPSGRVFQDALERQAVRSALLGARASGDLAQVGDELFHLAEIVASAPDLREAIAIAAVPLEGRRKLVADLVAGKTHPVTQLLADRAVGGTGGASFAHRIAAYLDLTGHLEGRQLAVITTAVPLTDAQRARARAAAEQLAGGDVELQETVDPGVVGGGKLTLSETVIDGTIANRLHELQRLTH